ncbi:MAG: MFS transporter, partial [Candidatus Tectomicrobia bacterium]|nr:MFS transporter [Candidatus Tectomicrobia bacterium]
MFERSLVSTKNPRYKWFVAASLMTGTPTFAISQTSINLALPKMMADLRVDVDEIKWVLTAFMITTTIMTQTVGWLGNRLGNKRLYILSLLCFILGSVLSGLAWDYHSLVFFRILQALGGGPMFPAAMTIMYAAFPPQEVLSMSDVISSLRKCAEGKRKGEHFLQFRGCFDGTFFVELGEFAVHIKKIEDALKAQRFL